MKKRIFLLPLILVAIVFFFLRKEEVDEASRVEPQKPVEVEHAEPSENHDVALTEEAPKNGTFEDLKQKVQVIDAILKSENVDITFVEYKNSSEIILDMAFHNKSFDGGEHHEIHTIITVEHNKNDITQPYIIKHWYKPTPQVLLLHEGLRLVEQKWEDKDIDIKYEKNVDLVEGKIINLKEYKKKPPDNNNETDA